jgi:DNA-binding response OmpR family regulator
MQAPDRILVIEDDDSTRRLVRELLTRHGHEVLTAEDGRAALRMFHEHRPDLVILDVGLPELDGWQTLERIRDMSDVPVVMLTASGGEFERVRGIRSGADDYLTKPFSLPELVARVEGLLERRRPSRADQRYADESLTVDFVTRHVTVKGEEVRLTPLEFKLLAALVRSPAETVSQQKLLGEVWGDRHERSSDPVRTYVRYLRRKLTDAGLGEGAIETVRGFGYRYCPP